MLSFFVFDKRNHCGRWLRILIDRESALYFYDYIPVNFVLSNKIVEKKTKTINYKYHKSCIIFK